MSSLKADLSRRQCEAEKTGGEKVDLDRRLSDLREEIIRAQSFSREAESTRLRFEQDTCRLTNEVDSLKSQLLQKDGDLRTTLLSLQEVQRQGGEEKQGMRAELT